MPPPALALRRISGALGIKYEAAKPARAQTADEAMRQALQAGFGVIHGRPDDPMLDFLDLPPRTH